MTDEEFAQIMKLRHELGGVEFKGPGPVSDGRLALSSSCPECGADHVIKIGKQSGQPLEFFIK